MSLNKAETYIVHVRRMMADPEDSKTTFKVATNLGMRAAIAIALDEYKALNGRAGEATFAELQ